MASTTHPAVSTFDAASVRKLSHVRWVFPAGKCTELQGKQVVGREPSCSTVLPGTEISRQHAEFRVDGPITAVRDLASRNGVFVNGKRVTEALLLNQDVVRCGEWIGVVVCEPSPGEFAEIAPGWYGGRALAAAAEPVRRLTGNLPLLVQGETGTGKEGMARAAHLWSGRSGEFVALNCAALPTELAEAELFGYRKGAFTGADSASPGLFRAAHGGSVFLDEILELAPALQAKLLRVLQEKVVRGIGETRDVPIDVRVIAATQEPLHEVVAQRRFRADLLARLDGLTVVLPSLRERREDVVPLFLEFLRQAALPNKPSFEPKLIEALCVYDWPLNVRELNVLTQRLASIHASERVWKRPFLPDRMLNRTSIAPEPAESDGARPNVVPALEKLEAEKRAWRRTDDDSEFQALLQALRKYGGSVAQAAGALGMSRSRAYRVLSAHPDFSLGELRK